uniref:C2H2-type domain-containing protein n=1 Tax=Eptatretus burgeri TaxID=7764 RepID=A0A8C4Q9F2_EPTBU
MVRVVGLGSEETELKSPSAVELIPGGVDTACHPSEVGKMSAKGDMYTDTQCKVCNAQLNFESQRIAHYQSVNAVVLNLLEPRPPKKFKLGFATPSRLTLKTHCSDVTERIKNPQCLEHIGQRLSTASC